MYNALMDEEYNYCAFCGFKTITRGHHVIPKSKGGGNELDNMQPMCSSCNHHKADKMEEVC